MKFLWILVIGYQNDEISMDRILVIGYKNDEISMVIGYQKLLVIKTRKFLWLWL